MKRIQHLTAQDSNAKTRVRVLGSQGASQKTAPSWMCSVPWLPASLTSRAVKATTTQSPWEHYFDWLTADVPVKLSR